MFKELSANSQLKQSSNASDIFTSSGTLAQYCTFALGITAGKAKFELVPAGKRKDGSAYKTFGRITCLESGGAATVSIGESFTEERFNSDPMSARIGILPARDGGDPTPVAYYDGGSDNASHVF